MTRDNFSDTQRETAREINASFTASRWRGELAGSGPHNECEVCHFVSNRRNDFEVDHIHPCASGGTANRWTQSQYAEASAGNIELIHQLGINEMVLCRGCNQAKKARQFVPPGAGWAYMMPHLDMNPDHIRNGAPKVTEQEIAQHPELYDVGRYRP